MKILSKFRSIREKVTLSCLRCKGIIRLYNVEFLEIIRTNQFCILKDFAIIFDLKFLCSIFEEDFPTFSSFSNEVFPDVFDLVVATSALFPVSVSFGDCCDEVELVLVRGLHMTLLADEVRPPLTVVRVVEFCFFSGIKSSTKVN